MLTQEQPDQQYSQENHFASIEEHPLPALPPGSIYSDEEVRVLGPSQRLRQRILSPIAFLLSRLHISANQLSYASVLLSLGFCLLAPFQFPIAFWLLMASVLCDGLDGVQARLTQTNMTAGSFTDVMCDVAVVAFCTAGLAWNGLIHPALAVLFVSVYTMLALFLVLHRLLHVSSKGIMRPSRMAFFAALALNFFLQIDLLNALLLLYLLAFPLLALSFCRLRKAL